MLTRDEARALMGASLACALMGASACAALTPGDATALEAVDAAACLASTLIPVIGPVLADVCIGEEGAVKAALDHALASQDAGVAAATAALASAPLVPVTRAHGKTRHRAARVPAPLASACQAYLDAHPAPVDGGAPVGSVRAVPVAGLVPFADAGVWHPEVVAGPWDAGTSRDGAP